MIHLVLILNILFFYLKSLYVELLIFCPKLMAMALILVIIPIFYFFK